MEGCARVESSVGSEPSYCHCQTTLCHTDDDVDCDCAWGASRVVHADRICGLNRNLSNRMPQNTLRVVVAGF